METETVKSVVDILASGGNAAALFIVFLVWRGIEHIRKVAEKIERIAINTEALPEIRKELRDLGADIESVDERLAGQDVRLAAALGIQPQNLPTRKQRNG
jgi:hypothetical protein